MFFFYVQPSPFHLCPSWAAFGHTGFTHSLVETNSSGWVGYTVICKYVHDIKRAQPPSSKKFFPDMMTETGMIRFVAAYTPPMRDSNHDVYWYYDQLTWVGDAARRHGRTTVVGGLNCKCTLTFTVHVNIHCACLADFATTKMSCKFQTIMLTMMQTKQPGRFAATWA